MANEPITKALIRLAVATRETIDAGVLSVYQEDVAEFAPDVVVEACERLRKTSQWFPKVAELLTMCRKIRGEHEAVTRSERDRRLEPPPMTPEQQAHGEAMRDKFLADLRAMSRSKRMPS